MGGGRREGGRERFPRWREPGEIGIFFAIFCNRETSNLQEAQQKGREPVVQGRSSALTSTQKAIIVPANMSCCLATSGTNTAGSVLSRWRDFSINWYLFP